MSLNYDEIKQEALLAFKKYPIGDLIGKIFGPNTFDTIPTRIPKSIEEIFCFGFIDAYISAYFRAKEEAHKEQIEELKKKIKESVK